MNDIAHLIEALVSLGWLVWGYFFIINIGDAARALERKLDEEIRKRREETWR